jgi:pyruvate dehydrogenase E2 component (dihydrolipoamide acetyltransferase)
MMSDTMGQGIVGRWLKQVGDRVQVGDSLVEIETDKAVMIYTSDAAGVLTEICAAEGDELPVGSVIARISP